MRVLVISDTHIPVTQNVLPKIIEEEARMSDCCLHAGDFITYEVFEKLSAWTKVYGVCGNMDNEEVQDKLPQKMVIELEQIKIGLIHGRGVPSRLINFVDMGFSKNKKEIDIFVFGHSHQPLDREIEGRIYFNPGSPTDKVFTLHRYYGILEIDGEIIKRRIIKIE